MLIDHVSENTLHRKIEAWKSKAVQFYFILISLSTLIMQAIKRERERGTYDLDVL